MPAADAVGQVEVVENLVRVVAAPVQPRCREVERVLLGLLGEEVGVLAVEASHSALDGSRVEILLVEEEPRPKDLASMPGHLRFRIELRRAGYVLVGRQHALAGVDHIVGAGTGMGDYYAAAACGCP